MGGVRNRKTRPCVPKVMRLSGMLRLLVALPLVASACSVDRNAKGSGSEAESEQGVERPLVEPTTAEERIERIRRVTGGACTQGRNASSHLAGIGFFCVPFDAIPAIDDPRFSAVSETRFLPDLEPVAAVEIEGRARAYPIRILITHEVVNDTIAGEPIVVSFCPLCNSAAAFSRRMGDRTLTFGVSGQLLSANLVMFDRETISLWQQVTGKAYSGEFAEQVLERLPIQMVAFGAWKDAHPRGKVLQEPVEGFDYGRDPYATYGRDASTESKFFRPPPGSGVTIRTDPRLEPKRRLLGVESAGEAVAFRLRQSL